uniref:Uncharacterized protein n=1 Tax=Romanomermis culicivorax TaxID=13658 RepID=A0A915KPP4_ROMCU
MENWVEKSITIRKRNRAMRSLISERCIRIFLVFLEESLTSSISDAGTYNNVKNLIFDMQTFDHEESCDQHTQLQLLI